MRDMRQQGADSVRRKWRSRLFRAWLVASFVIAVYVGIAGPVAGYFGDGRTVVALAVPAVMVFMLATGLGWLVFFVASRWRHGG